MKDLIDIDGFEDNIEDDGLSNKLLNENFYLILLPSVYDYLDHIDFFIFIWSKGVGKEIIAIIVVIFVTVGTSLIATAETVVTPGKEIIAVIIVISITAGMLLVTTTEIIVTLGTRLD